MSQGTLLKIIKRIEEGKNLSGNDLNYLNNALPKGVSIEQNSDGIYGIRISMQGYNSGQLTNVHFSIDDVVQVSQNEVDENRRKMYVACKIAEKGELSYSELFQRVASSAPGGKIRAEELKLILVDLQKENYIQIENREGRSANIRYIGTAFPKELYPKRSTWEPVVFPSSSSKNHYDENDVWVTVGLAAELYGCDVHNIYGLRDAGHVKAKKDGKTWLFNKHDLLNAKRRFADKPFGLKRGEKRK